MGTFGRPGAPAYSAAKAGILGLTRALAHELAM
jgi:NAD(P)-dependent dehydrogenase (short-subunit alcohol dehydrogenase family)